jgi:hypothetical protein
MGIDPVLLVVLEFVSLPDRFVPAIVIICAGDIRGRDWFTGGAGVATPAGPVLGVPATCATYWSGSVGVSGRVFSPDIPCFAMGLEAGERTEHPLVPKSRITKRHATIPGVYIVNFRFL